MAPQSRKARRTYQMEDKETADLQGLLGDITSVARSETSAQNQVPIEAQTPKPASTKLYNNLLDNLLSSLHYYFELPPSTSSTEYVLSWDPQTGTRSTGDARLLAIEADCAYLVPLEIYRKLHAKSVFDQDLENTKKRLADIFSQQWHSDQNWPLGAYFDLAELYDITGDKQYIDWADRFAIGDSPNDPSTPFTKARGLEYTFQGNHPRVGSPFYFLHAALLADYGKRKDPALVDPSQTLFEGLRDLILDTRYSLLINRCRWRQPEQCKNLNQVFDSLENLTAVRDILTLGP